MKILLLEDDPMITDIIKEYLDKFSYEVICCSDGEFDLRVLDMNVTNVTGLEILENIKHFSKNVYYIKYDLYEYKLFKEKF